MKTKLLTLAALAQLAFILPESASAQSLSWTATGDSNLGGTGTWDTTSSLWWDGALAITWGNTTTSDAVFTGTAGNVTVDAGGVTAHNLTFSTTGYILSGGPITLAGTTPTIDVGASQTATISTANLLGSAGLIKAGSGTLSLGSNKTFTGGVQVNAGIITFTTGGGLGSNTITLGDTSGSADTVLNWVNIGTATSASAVIVRSTGGNKTFQITSGVTGTISSLTLSGNIIKTSAGTLTVTGATSLDGGSRDITVNSGTVNLSGPVSETSGTGFGIVKQGTGTLTMTGNNTYTGGTTINAGTISMNRTESLGAIGGNVTFGGNSTLAATASISNARNFTIGTGVVGTLDVATSMTYTCNGVLTGDGALAKAGNGTLTITKNSTSFTGGVLINNGTLVISTGAGITNPFGTGGVFLGATSGSSNATLQVGNNVTYPNSLTVQSGSSGIKSINISTTASPGFSGGTTLNDNLTINNNAAGSNLNFTTNPFALNGSTLTLNSNGTNAGTVTISFAITGNDTSAINFGGTTTVAGKLSLGGNNTFSGTVTVNPSSGGGATVLQLNHVNALQNATLNTGASGNQSVTLVVTGNNTYNIGALTGSDALAITSSNVLSVGAKVLDTTFSGNLTGTGSLAKVGGNSLTLSGTNTYTGGTTLSAGTLVLATSSTLTSATGSLSVAGGNLTSNVPDTVLGSDLLLGSGSLIPNLTAVGSFTLVSGKTFSMSGGTWNLNITGDLTFDKIVSAGGTPTFTITGGTIDLTGGTINYGINYAIFSAFGTGSVNSLAITGYDTTNYLAALGTDGNLAFTAVPEPGTWILVGIGLTFLLHRKRSRHLDP